MDSTHFDYNQYNSISQLGEDEAENLNQYKEILNKQLIFSEIKIGDKNVDLNKQIEYFQDIISEEKDNIFEFNSDIKIFLENQMLKCENYYKFEKFKQGYEIQRILSKFLIFMLNQIKEQIKIYNFEFEKIIYYLEFVESYREVNIKNLIKQEIDFGINYFPKDQIEKLLFIQYLLDTVFQIQNNIACLNFRRNKIELSFNIMIRTVMARSLFLNDYKDYYQLSCFLNNLGFIYKNINYFIESEKCFNKSLQIFEGIEIILKKNKSFSLLKEQISYNQYKLILLSHQFTEIMENYQIEDFVTNDYEKIIQLLAISYNIYGTVLQNFENKQKQIQFSFDQADKLAKFLEKLDNKRVQKSQILNNTYQMQTNQSGYLQKSLDKSYFLIDHFKQ